MARYLGLDGYRGGWVAAWIDEDGSHGFDYSPGLERLLSIPHKRAMIDIPIGLKESGHRNCDIEARRRLGPCVFLGARRDLWLFCTQASANAYYWRHEGKGMGISCQIWNIRCKIKEADDFITPDRQSVFSETHPELIFWALNRQRALRKKKTTAGADERVRLLVRCGFTRIERWLGWRFATGIARDDLLDACACAIAARDANKALGSNEMDGRGLRMEINYFESPKP